jgi:hypothetical protein
VSTFASVVLISPPASRFLLLTQMYFPAFSDQGNRRNHLLLRCADLLFGGE